MVLSNVYQVICWLFLVSLIESFFVEKKLSQQRDTSGEHIITILCILHNVLYVFYYQSV